MESPKAALLATNYRQAAARSAVSPSDGAAQVNSNVTQYAGDEVLPRESELRLYAVQTESLFPQASPGVPWDPVRPRLSIAEKAPVNAALRGRVEARTEAPLRGAYP